MNSKFTIRRFKVLIHQNGSGEPSSKYLKQDNSIVNNSILSSSSKSESSLGNHRSNYFSFNSNTSTPKNNNEQSKAITIETNQNTITQTTGGLYKLERQNNDIIKQTVKTINEQINEENTDTDVQSTINQVVGKSPMYSGLNNFNICVKISQRLNDIMTKQGTNKINTRKFAVIVGSGSFNPLTRMHIRTFFLAKQYLETKIGFTVLGSLLSPAHGVTVRERYRTNPSEIIPSPHRLAVAQLLVENSKWLTVDPWEIMKRRAMDYLRFVFIVV